MDIIRELAKRGYSVEVAQKHDGFDVYRVEGPGLSTHVRSDDTAALESVLAAHDEHIFQLELSSEELNAWRRLTLADDVAVEPPPSNRKGTRPLVNGKRVAPSALPELAADLVPGE